MKAPANAGRWLAAALILVIVVVEVADAVRAGGANPRIPAIQASGVAGAGGPAASNRPLGIPHDWSHRQLIFSRPASPEAARRLERDPRYRIQQAWRQRQAVAGTAEAYMQSLDALAVQLAAGSRTVSATNAKHKPKLPVGAWGESLNVLVANPNGNANYPAKFAFTSSTSCSDWVVFTAPVIGSSTQFNIFAFKNLYSSVCSGTPTLKFTYNASNSSGPLLTAPVISLAGDQVAFVEKGASAHFHVLKFADVGTPLPTFPNPSSLSSCVNSSTPPPCGYFLNYDSAASANFSAPFYDYASGQDTAYVSADDGKVFAISPVFGGNPPGVKTGWGVSVSTSSTMLSAPVYDGVSKNVFVGDQQGLLYYIRTQASSAGTCNGLTSGTPCVGDSSFTNSLCTGSAAPFGCCTGAGTGHCRFLAVSGNTTQITEPVIVDSNTGKVFVFSKGNPTGAAGSSVVQTDVQFGIRNVASIGSGAVSTIHVGAFDDKYYSDPTTGNLYVCGQNGGTPQLYAFGFTNTPTAGTMNTSPVSGAPKPLSTVSTTCSPLTEDKSGTTDRLFLAVASACPASGATGAGCVASFDITNGFPSLPSAPPYSITFSQVLGTSTGTTGIIIDNLSGTTNQTNIYFETQGAGSSCSTYNGGTASGSCAVSLTQSSLN